MYLPLAESAQPPKFKACAKHPKVEENGFVLYYTDQCPYTYYWVPKVQEAAKEHGIPFKTIHITEKETAQKCARTGHNIRIVPGWEVCDPEHPVGQEIFEIGRRSGLNHTTEVIDFLCLSVIPFVTRPTALLSSPMVETPGLKEIFRKTQRGDHF